MMNYRRVTSVSGVLLVFGLLIGGCGDPQTVDSAEVDASQSLQSEDVIEKQSLRTVSSDELSSSDLADASSEQTLDELVAAWEDVTGESCALESSDSTEFGATSLSCDSATVLSTYESTTGLRQQLKSADELFKMADMQGSRLVGINWGMNVDAALIEDLHEDLGGIRVDLGSQLRPYGSHIEHAEAATLKKLEGQEVRRSPDFRDSALDLIKDKEVFHMSELNQ